ncbi:HAD family hydrolase [Halopelagius longus]|uniref:HAD family hydrolase n=1 Tax=Halopelagius longus TaxID=1236180 RepID=A0A1H0XSM9_9EURY|nr:HAD family hydrolase [Halopelagius longus]RDI72050.1 HAD family hydrolase [Halopelagius longus]SDQ05676.1 haloacid dehalogenase superfamily, subfamily IA, variant 1 with third motif having Dx(3-4)D or Dx(3-4)E [Halopelagius longus]
MSYDAVIFDDDGVLAVPTATDVRRRAVRTAFAEFSVEPTTEGVDSVVHGSIARIRRVCDVHGIDHEEFWKRHEAAAAAAQIEAMERGRKTLYDDVSALSGLDQPMAVVGDTQREAVEHLVDRFGLEDLFEAAYGREPSVEGFRRRKPSPHYLARAVEELGAENVLYVGDSNVDVLAASRAGVDSAFVRRPHRANYELAADPTYEVRSLRDVVSLC